MTSQKGAPFLLAPPLAHKPLFSGSPCCVRQHCILVRDRQDSVSGTVRGSLLEKVAVVSSLQGFPRRFRDACLALPENTSWSAASPLLSSQHRAFALSSWFSSLLSLLSLFVSSPLFITAVGYLSLPLGPLVLIRNPSSRSTRLGNLQSEAAPVAHRPTSLTHQPFSPSTLSLGNLH